MVFALVGHVGLGVRPWDSRCGSEVLDCLAVLGAPKQQGVGAYYNKLLELADTYPWVRGARVGPK